MHALHFSIKFYGFDIFAKYLMPIAVIATSKFIAWKLIKHVRFKGWYKCSLIFQKISF